MVFGISASSSSTAPSSVSSPSSSQESTSANKDSVSENRGVEAPVSERNGGTNEELRGDPLHESTETENQNKNEGSQEVQRDISHHLPDLLQEFRENLVDESTSTKPWENPEQGSQHTSKSSHEFPMEPRAYMEPGLGKQSVYTHFPKDTNSEICLTTKITKASCRRRADVVMPRAENFGDLITADHKVHSESCESRNNHRYAIVVQDLATQWIQSYPCKILEPDRKPKVIYTDNSLELGKACEDESLYVDTTQIRNKWDC